MAIPATVLTSGAAVIAGPAAAAVPGWSSARVLSHRYSQLEANAPSVAVNASGAADATWQADDGSIDPTASVAARDAGGHWGSVVNVLPAHHTGQAFVGVGGRGRDVAVWSDTPPHSDATSTRWMQRAPGGSWGPRRVVPGAEHRTVDSFSMNSAGYGVATYEDGGVLTVQVLQPNGHWRIPMRISRPMRFNFTVGAYGASAVVSATGSVTVAWTWASGDGQSPYCWIVKRGGVRADGQVLTPVRLTKKVCGDGGVEVPRLRAASTGPGLSIAWTNGSTHAYATTEVWNGHAWHRHDLASPKGSHATQVSVTMTSTRADAYWSTESGSGATIWHTRLTGPTWTAPVALRTIRRTGTPDSGTMVVTLASGEYGARGSVAWTALPGGADSYATGVHRTVELTTVGTSVLAENYPPRSTIWAIASAGAHGAMVFTTRPATARLEDVRVRTR